MSKKINPFAVCKSTVSKENPEKLERCIKKLKKKEAFNLKKLSQIQDIIDDWKLPEGTEKETWEPEEEPIAYINVFKIEIQDDGSEATSLVESIKCNSEEELEIIQEETEKEYAEKVELTRKILCSRIRKLKYANDFEGREEKLEKLQKLVQPYDEDRIRFIVKILKASSI